MLTDQYQETSSIWFWFINIIVV